MALCATGKELVKELRGIWDDKDFVRGAMNNAGREAAWKKMLDYILIAKQNGDEVTSDDILLLSLVLGEENE